MKTLVRGHSVPYIGRFAPWPTGPLHAGSLVAALASWLDARAHAGQWLVRIEDIDTPRCVPGADALILQQLAAFGLLPDAPPLYQSRRNQHYRAALDQLIDARLAYPCACTRQDIERALTAHQRPRARHAELVYPGTCRQGLNGRPVRAWRFLTEYSDGNRPCAHVGSEKSAIDSIANRTTYWQDRRLGAQQQHVASEVGDFVLKRADGLWAYQLAVVVDDSAQGITDIVRGEDLADTTARQILLLRALGLALPRYLHTPLVLGANGEKLSKQNGAAPLDMHRPLQALAEAGQALGLPTGLSAETPAGWLRRALPLWASRLKLWGD